MSKYTTEVRFICETDSGLTESKGFNSISDIIETAAPKVFNFDFPMFDEAYRLPLEIKILRHYYTREICEETVGLWKLRLQDRLNVIMPYYNQLYKSELLEFNPLYDVDISRDHKRDNEGESISSGTGETTTTGNGSSNRTQVIDTDTTNNNTSSGTATGTMDTTITGKSNDDGTRWDLYSDTPQGGIDVITNDSDDVANNTYLSNARKITDTKDVTTEENSKGTNSNTNTVTDNGSGTVDTTVTDNESTTNTGTSNTTTSGKNTITNTEDYLEHVKGKQGSLTYSKMLSEFRETFLNIDKMIINDLSDLFFGLW